jgi:hypothetical protein
MRLSSQTVLASIYCQQAVFGGEQTVKGFNSRPEWEYEQA